ncbi:hypothetical protein [Lacrimispora amygdalina]|uniref:hypothetical protein n=1 Tax=Lacrimispora amygdalina TaxID=253257 RepID=UPI001478103B|nr:hypothetical protein [Clostridium indicum]
MKKKYNDRYEVLSEFDCCGEHMMTVRFRGNVHVMTLEELKCWYGRMHPERWDRKAS